jgi:hypothetical protein
MANADILSRHSCGFNLSLQKGSDENVGMGSIYNTFIESIVNNPDYPGTISSNPKVFPVVFHVFINGGVEIPDFDPEYILEHVNYNFLGSHISFETAKIDPDGNILATPGLNIVDGSTISEVRGEVGSNGTTTHTYVEDMVAVTENLSDAREVPGVTLNYLYTNYRWSIDNNERYLNVFVVNRLRAGLLTNGKDSSVYMSAEHPYVAEQLSETHKFNCAIEFATLGNCYYDKYGNIFTKGGPTDAVTNFGYDYLASNIKTNSPYNSYLFRGGDTGFFRQRGRSLVHCFGHMLGLTHPSTQLRELEKECAGDTNVFSDTLNNNTVYKDNISDTENVKFGEIGVDYNAWYTTNECSDDDNTVFTSASNHMTISQREGPPGVELGGPSTIFTAGQVLWMHANCEVEFYGESGFHPGILKEILIHSNDVIPTIINTDIEPCELIQARSTKNTAKEIGGADFKIVDDEVPIFRGLLNAIKKLKEHHQNG